MIITNQTSADYFFGPIHLPSGSGQSITIDDTTDTSLYLLNDEVADAVNTLYLSSNITVSGQALPFPRPTGTPALLHGDGSPQGMVYAPPGSLYMRRDSTSGTSSLYTKTTGVTQNIGWIPVFGSGLAFIEEIVVPSGGQDYIDFSSIPQNFSHLKIVASLKTVNLGDEDTTGLYMVVNGVGGQYSVNQIYGVNGSSAGFQSFGQGSAGLGLLSADYFGTTEITLGGYTNTQSVPFNSTVGMWSSTESATHVTAGVVYNTGQPVTEIRLQLPDGGSTFAQHSVATLYGLVGNAT